MQTYRLALTACLRRLENGTVVAESPSFPELSCTAGSARQALSRLQRGTKKLAQRLRLEELALRQSIGPVETDELRMTIEPPVRSPAWEQPVEVCFAAVRWPHQTDGWVMWLPALGIHVLGRTEKEVRESTSTHVRAALARGNSKWAAGADGVTLPRVAELQRTTRVRLVPMTVEIPVRTPKQAAQIAEQENDPKKSVLKEATDSVTRDPIPPMIGNEAIVEHIASLLTGRRPRSVLLVGPSGVGKTAAFRELVRRRDDFGLSGIEFRTTSGARLVAGMSSFGMWQERCQSLCRETERTGAIVHLGSLAELMEVGRCEGNSMGMAGFLRPYLVRGALLAVAECTPEQLALVERLHPQVVQAFEQVRVTEPDAEISRRILSHLARHFPQPVIRAGNANYGPVTLIDEAGLAAVDRLHRRYATYSAFPGRPLRFLKNLLRDRLDSIQLRGYLNAPRSDTEAVGPLTESDVIFAFSRETGLPRFLLDDRVPFDPEEARAALSRRVVGQGPAIERSVALLSTLKAGLARSGKPLASLLFIGPTGVGKTELARTLAEYLFGDEGRLTRFDMSEYGDPISAQRLMGGAFGDEGILTAKIREQPFSVVLLDEFEKADATVFDLLLQVLGEGRLTDAGGRLADFTNSVIVLTSNLGAEAYQQGAAGFARSRSDMSDHFLEAVRRFLRPELFNRFDGIVPFAPLNADILGRIAEMQVARLRHRDGLLLRARGWELEPEVVGWLTARGFDPLYGARPLKRAIERELLTPMSEQLNAVRPELAVSVKIGLVEERLSVMVTPVSDAAGRAIDWMQPDAGLATIASNVTVLRRRTRRLTEGPPVRALKNELYRLDTQLERERRRMLKRTALGKPWQPAPDHAVRLSRAAALRTLIDDLAGLLAQVDLLEDDAVLGLMIETFGHDVDIDSVARADHEWWRLASEVYLQQFPNPHKGTLAVFSEHRQTLVDLIQAYCDMGKQLGATRSDLWEFASSQQGVASERVEFDNPEGGPLWKRLVANPSAYLSQLPNAVVGLAWSFDGHGLIAHLLPEAGLHVFTKGNGESLCLVLVEAGAADEFRPPAGISRQGTIAKRGKKDRRRQYDLDQNFANDPLLNQRVSWRTTSLAQALGELTRRRFQQDVAEAVCGETVNDEES